MSDGSAPKLEPADDYIRGCLHGLALSVSLLAASKGNLREFQGSLTRAQAVAEEDEENSPTPDYHRAKAATLEQVARESY